MNALSGKKVLFVITKSNWGGAQWYVYTLATAAKKVGAHVTVLFGGTGAPGAESGLLATRLQEDGVRTLFLKSFARDIGVLREFHAFSELLSVIRQEKPEILHLNSSKAGGLGALAGSLCGVPKIIFTAHGWAHREPRNPLSRLVIWLASWATITLAHTVVCVSQYDYKNAPVFFSRRKLVMIHNGIDLSMPFASGERIRSAFPPGAHIVGTIGELSKNKNQIALVERAHKEPNLYVAIVGGEGDESARIKSAIQNYALEDRVKLFGFVPAPEVMKGFDEFALPSLKEGLPTVLLEARAAGLPIVANRVGGVSEILDAPDLKEFSLEKMIERTFALYRA